MIKLFSFCVSPGVLVLSWYPPGLADDNGEPAEDLVPAVLDAAYRHNLKVKGISTFWVCVCVYVWQSEERVWGLKKCNESNLFRATIFSSISAAFFKLSQDNLSVSVSVAVDRRESFPLTMWKKTCSNFYLFKINLICKIPLKTLKLFWSINTGITCYRENDGESLKTD